MCLQACACRCAYSYKLTPDFSCSSSPSDAMSPSVHVLSSQRYDLVSQKYSMKAWARSLQYQVRCHFLCFTYRMSTYCLLHAGIYVPWIMPGCTRNHCRGGIEGKRIQLCMPWRPVGVGIQQEVKHSGFDAQILFQSEIFWDLLVESS